ncbi:MAG: hypothetical protein N2513_06540 [Deltaproteobacteria bacterium]|nr:hypothetical protein [Deltaproteobacteria bacterium]
MSNKRGIALVSILGMIVIGSILLGLFLYFLYRATDISILEKKYRTEKDAALGAVEFLSKELLPTSIQIAASSTQVLDKILSRYTFTENAKMNFLTTDECYANKLLKATNQWGGACSNSSDPKTFPDLKFTLKGESSVPFVVYVKIVDTVQGNTNTQATSLEGAGVAESLSGLINPQHFPYIYRIEVQAEREVNPQERVSLEVLYAY